MLRELTSLTLAVTTIILVIIFIKIGKNNENFAFSYDPKCLNTCHTQSTNADDQCMNDCQMPSNNKCWQTCFQKAAHFDDYLRCGVRCPDHYFSS